MPSSGSMGAFIQVVWSEEMASCGAICAVAAHDAS
jgi:hypothetical protein